MLTRLKSSNMFELNCSAFETNGIIAAVSCVFSLSNVVYSSLAEDMSSRISLCVCSFPSVLSGWAFRLEITKQRRALVLIYSVRSASMVDKENSRTLGFSGDASICPSDKSRNNIEGGGDAILRRNRDLSLGFFSIIERSFRLLFCFRHLYTHIYECLYFL